MVDKVILPQSSGVGLLERIYSMKPKPSRRLDSMGSPRGDTIDHGPMKCITGKSTSLTRTSVVASPVDPAHRRTGHSNQAPIGGAHGTRLTESNGNKEIKTTVPNCQETAGCNY